MTKKTLTPAMAADYVRLFETCVIRPERQAAVETMVDKIIVRRDRYESVAAPFQMPWAVLGVMHSMEASLDFTKHLHNGDPLTARTKQVPAGRPETGNPPFTWEESARDALVFKGLKMVAPWTLPKTLFTLERFNGFGYRNLPQPIPSPYLWSFSTHYAKGKYVADKKYSPTAVSAQVGAAVLLRRLAERGQLVFADQPPPGPADMPMVIRWTAKKSSDAAEQARVLALQSWLSTHSGIWLNPDGHAGNRTSDAYRAVTGQYLPGDPRG